MKLDIGAGPLKAHTRRHLTVDAYAPADVKAEMWDLPFPDGSVDDIWTSHALEHIARERVLPTLCEWFRVLRPDGTLTLSVPNLDYAARYWLSHQGEPWALAVLFGNQKHEGEFHKTGWSPDTLRADILAAGFTVRSLDVIWDH